MDVSVQAPEMVSKQRAARKSEQDGPQPQQIC